MKKQALFSSVDKSKKLKCCLLQFLFGTLRVNPLQRFITTYRAINLKISLRVRVPLSSMIIGCLIPAMVSIHVFASQGPVVQN